MKSELKKISNRFSRVVTYLIILTAWAYSLFKIFQLSKLGERLF